MELIVTYKFFDERTSNVTIKPHELEGLKDILQESSKDGNITSVIDLEEEIQDFIWNNIEFEPYFKEHINEILEISLKSPLIRNLVEQYKYLINPSCCVNGVGNYCSNCGKRLIK